MTTKTTATEEEPQKKSIGRHAAVASLWTAGSTIATQVLRLASNLILSRLLFPEAFGLMALTNSILQGLEMFSDLGVGPSIIHAKDPHPRLLDVAFSLHVVRGIGLWVVSMLLAYPAMLWYADKRLLLLLPAVGFTSAIRGFSSRSVFTLARDMKLRELSQIEIGSQLVFVLAASGGALAWPSVWTLVFGGWAGAIAYTVLSYTVVHSPRPRWCWDREALRSITRFGRWVLFSTILTYLLGQGDRLILGSFMTFAQLGLYQIANVIARAVNQLSTGVSGRVLFPLYAKIGRETTPELLRRISKVRLATMTLLLPPAWVLTCFGDFPVRWLWDDRYEGAGWMVRVLAASGVFASFGVGPINMARGEPWISFGAGVCQACVLIPGMIIGAHFWGPPGLVVAVAFSQMGDYLFEIWMQRRYKVWLPWFDVVGVALSAVAIAGGLLLRRWLGIPG